MKKNQEWNKALADSGRSIFLNFFREEKQRGEPRHKIRMVKIDWNDEATSLCLNQMLRENIIERTDDESICIPTQLYYESIPVEDIKSIN